VDDAPVELRFARFVAAMKESRTADAERELAALKERLPAGSLGLVRAQAWFDLRAGRDAAAAEGYRTILERLPGDEEAAINLASIQSRQQKTEEARATLDAASRLQPDSAALRAALAQFTPAARQ
jgi:predicted Zn-dependent protease